MGRQEPIPTWGAAAVLVKLHLFGRTGAKPNSRGNTTECFSRLAAFPSHCSALPVILSAVKFSADPVANSGLRLTQPFS